MSQTFSLQFLKSGTQYIGELESGNSIIAGRSSDCDLKLSEHLQDRGHQISRRHFMITSREDNFFITDLNSMNGTQLNGERLSKGIAKNIHDCDMIMLARRNDFMIQFVINEENRDSATMIIDDAYSEHDYPKEPALQFDGQDLFIDNQLVSLSLLSSLEEKLLNFLYQNANRVCSYREIALHVWGGEIGKDSIRMLMKRLRKKMDEITPNSGKRFIKTIHGYGYKITLD